MSFLEISELSVSKGSKNIIENLNLGIGKNEFIVILGPSGCGKTTLLNAIVGFEKTNTGTIIVNNQEVIKPTKDILMMFQEDDLYPWMTINENLLIGFKKKELTLIKQKIKQYLKKFNLKNCLNKYPYELSVGMKKRISLMKMLIHTPKLFLMDEVFNSLDTIIKRKIYDVFLDLTSKNKSSVIFVTHDISEAIYLADKIVLMTDSPMQIKEVIDVSFSQKRNEAIYFTDNFKKLEQHIYNSLKGEVK